MNTIHTTGPTQTALYEANTSSRPNTEPVQSDENTMGACSSKEHPNVATSAKPDPLQQQQQYDGPVSIGSVQQATPGIGSDAAKPHRVSVTISPASSNQNLKFELQFKQVFTVCSLRRAFTDQVAYKEIFCNRLGASQWGERNESTMTKKFPGRIVAVSEDVVAAAPPGAGKSTETAAAAATAAAVGADYALSSAPKGLISAVMTAYSRHCDLVLSPDDVWLTILAQFCAYVNNSAEGLRGRIVGHKGKRGLSVQCVGSLETVDYPRMIRKLLEETRANIKSPELADWFRPGFSTTTEKDEVCAAATAMATLQAYFEYEIRATCGIPSVTLLGTVADWTLLQEKVERMLEFEAGGNPEGNVMELWVGYLRKVCDGFVESAKHPGSAKTLEFWDKVFSHNRMGSGMDYITGWLSAFTCFNADGRFIGKDVRDGTEFPMIGEKKICHNVVSCPVKIDDNGYVHDGRLFVGQVALEAQRGVGKDYPTVRPRNDWCMAVAVKY